MRLESNNARSSTRSSLSSPVASPLQPHRRKVSFGSVGVREFNRIAGDHPDCTVGPPMSIDWKFYEHPPISVDHYEEGVGHHRHNSSSCEKISSDLRKEILQYGFQVPYADLVEAEKQATKVARLREQTRKQLDRNDRTRKLLKNTASKVFKFTTTSSSSSSAKVADFKQQNIGAICA